MLLCICDTEFYPVFAEKRQCDCLISAFGSMYVWQLQVQQQLHNFYNIFLQDFIYLTAVSTK